MSANNQSITRNKPAIEINFKGSFSTKEAMNRFLPGLFMVNYIQL